jgi:hypothetical protein
MMVVWTIIPILILLLCTVSVILREIAWRDFRRRKFPTFEEKQKFRRMLFWSGWGSYKYLCAVRNKEPVLLPYIKILGAIGLLVLIWVIARDVPIAARVMVTPVALAMFYEAYVLIKNHHSSREYKKAHD